MEQDILALKMFERFGLLQMEMLDLRRNEGALSFNYEVHAQCLVKYLLFISFLLSFPQLLSVEAAIVHRVAPYM